MLMILPEVGQRQTGTPPVDLPFRCVSAVAAGDLLVCEPDCGADDFGVTVAEWGAVGCSRIRSFAFGMEVEFSEGRILIR